MLTRQEAKRLGLRTEFKTYSIFDITEWETNPTINVIETMSYPLEKVDFPTVTLCPVSPDPDRWGFAVKLFDYLEVHCVKPLFPINSQNPQETISKFQQIRKEYY